MKPEEQSGSSDHINDAETLTKMKWGKCFVSLWDMPGTEPATEPEGGTLGVSPGRASELQHLRKVTVHLGFFGTNVVFVVLSK